METFRCPVCIGVLQDVRAQRCSSCGQNMRRRRPRVLGEETRVAAHNLPIDRLMLERIHGSMHSRRRSSLPPVAWHGKFTTSPLAEPDFSSTPSPVATPLAPPTVGGPSQIIEPEPDIDIEAPATVGALALDVYTRPLTTGKEHDDARAITSVPALDDTAVVDDTAPIPVYEVPIVSEAVAPLAPLPIAVPHEELDPDVRAIVDELYQQARAELSGADLTLFAPFDGGIEDDIATLDSEPPLDLDVTTSAFELPPVIDHAASAVEATEPQSPAASNPQAVPAQDATRPTPRGGWVAAFTPNERRRRQSTD